MRKAFLGMMVLVLAIVVGMSGCQKTKESAPKAGSSPQATSAPSIVIKFAVGAPDTLPIYQAAKEVFKPQIEAKSNGRIKVELYANSQLGDDVSLIQQLRAGTLEACGPVTSPLVGVAPGFAVFDIPFLFSSPQVADKVLDGKVGQELSATLESKGLYNLGWSEMGYRNLTNSARQVVTPAEVKGLKIRTMENPVQLATWRLLGANPTPMPVSEVFTALKQHAVDGQDNPLSAIYGWKFYEVNKYITLTGHIYSPLLFLFSKSIFDSYPKADQELIRQVAKETAIRGRAIAREQDTKYLDEIQKSGLVTITTLTPAQKKAFQDATMPIWDLVEKSAGSDLISELKAEVAKASE